jgi:hypothetical protein
MNQKHWTETDDEYLKDNYGNIPLVQICNHLNRSAYSVRWRASYLGIALLASTRKEWTKDEMVFLAENCATHTYQELAALLGRGLSSVAHKVAQLKITQVYQHDKDNDDSDIEGDIPYRKGKANEFMRKMSKMKVGDSFLFPASEYQTIRNMIKYFPERYYRTKTEETDVEIKRIWRLL